MHGVAQLAQTFGRAAQAVDEFRGDRPQNERLAVALDGQLGADRKFHLLADLGGDDDLAFGAQGSVFGLHREMVGGGKHKVNNILQVRLCLTRGASVSTVIPTKLSGRLWYLTFDIFT